MSESQEQALLDAQDDQETQERERRRQDSLRRLKLLRPIDDEFMRCLFRDCIPLAQLVLRIITGMDDLTVISCETQRDLKRLAGARSVCLDVFAVDSAGKAYNLEIQRADKGSEPYRARYHASVLDVENLDAKKDFAELPETYVIFITEKDFFGQGAPVYPVERINLVTGKPFEDGEHILYVNGEFRDESELGKLMHDFSCAEASEMHHPLMAERTRYWKESKEGVSAVCKVIEDMLTEERENAAKRNTIEIVKALLAEGTISLEAIARCARLTIDEVKKLQSGQSI